MNPRYKYPYPYYLVVVREGRLPTPPQYRGTPVAKMFESGRIGGTRTQEVKLFKREDVVALARREEQRGARVEVLIVTNPGFPRKLCREWRQPHWDGVR